MIERCPRCKSVEAINQDSDGWYCARCLYCFPKPDHGLWRPGIGLTPGATQTPLMPIPNVTIEEMLATRDRLMVARQEEDDRLVALARQILNGIIDAENKAQAHGGER